MGIRDFFNHRCNISHLRAQSVAPGFGIPPTTSQEYPTTPDELNVVCHFNTAGDNVRATQGNPTNILTKESVATFPIGTDVRANDMLSHIEENIAYTVEGPPKNIRGNHIKVQIYRRVIQEEI